MRPPGETPSRPRWWRAPLCAAAGDAGQRRVKVLAEKTCPRGRARGARRLLPASSGSAGRAAGGSGRPPRGSRRRSRACCAARGGSGELLQGNCEPGPSRRRRPLRKCWERGGLRGGWRVPQCKLSVQSAQNARGAGQPQAGDAPLGFPRAAQQV